MQTELEMAVAAVVTDWSGDRYVNGNNQSLTQYMTKARVESNMNTEDYVLTAFTLNTTNGVSVTYKNKGYNFTVTITDSGNSAKVTYEGEGEPTEVKEWIENEDGSVTNGEVTLQVGDYINYNPLEGVAEENTTYTSLATATGYTDQVFDIQNYVDGGWRWQVFGVEDGKLQIISENTIGTTEVDEDKVNKNYYLRGRTGYQNAITELNNISELYGQGEYAESARSITVEDVNKFTGYNPEVYEEGELGEYGNVIDYFWQGTDYPYYSSTRAGNGLSGSLSVSHNNSSFGNSFWWYDFEAEEWKSSPYQSGATTPAEPITESSLEGDNYITTLESNDYDYTGSDYISDTSSSLYKMLFDDVQYTGENSSYWLASRSVAVGSGCALFGVHRIGDGGVDFYDVVGSYGRELYNYYGVRPLVSLQSNIQLTSAGANTWDISDS